MGQSWTKNDIGDLYGKVAVVTGASSGIGYETAKTLAEKRATVVFAVRNADKGTAAAGKIKAGFPGADVSVMAMDLSDLASIRGFAADFLARYDSLSLLINNAGVLSPKTRYTQDGFEMQFGCNHLGHFALTGLLLGRLISTPKSRVVTVSSNTARNARLEFNQTEAFLPQDKLKGYGTSKLANLLFALELQTKFRERGIDCLSIACHPGMANTNVISFGAGKAANPWLRLVYGLISQSAEMGALPSLYAATEPSIRGGEYIGPKGWGGLKGYPEKLAIAEQLYDPDASRKLWEVSERLTGVTYSFS
ncbi:oxidoreductase [Paenibacillus macerans]|uniref:oxidoreductase n=1 Tax=Paenibacillus macerans TaxID=44252 RepID=UPI003D31F60B